MTARVDQTIRNLEDFAAIASDWFWETDSALRFTYFSARFEEVTSIKAADLIGKRRDDVTAEDATDPRWQSHFDDLANRRPFRDFEYQVRRPHVPGPLWIRIAGQPLFDEAGQFLGYRGTGHDVTAEKTAMLRLEQSNATLQERNRQLDEARQLIERAAFEDSLTGLANRRAFERDLERATTTPGVRVGLLHIDLDRFKWVNDTFGHPAGDEVLRQAATRLQAATSDCGTIYRIGGDEFTVILQHDVTSDQADWVGDSIVDTMNKPISVAPQQIVTGASVGVAVSDAGPTDRDSLIRNADMALYAAKRRGRGAACRITAAQMDRIDDQRRLVGDIPAALERGEFIPYFQPQLDANTNRIIGVEALVRWQHPKRGLLLPGAFIDVASTLGLMGEIDRVVLRESMAAVNRLAAMGLVLPALSVNISETRLLDPQFPTEVAEHWTERRCQLCLELLETIYFDEMADNLHFAQALRKLRNLGVAIDIDDFGSGRASITGLIKIRPDRLKIDRGLIKAAIDDPGKRGIISAIVDIAGALQITCIAEGVENTADIDVICGLGCTVFQGFTVAYPLCESDLAAFLAAHDLMQDQEEAETKTAGHEGLPKIA